MHLTPVEKDFVNYYQDIARVFHMEHLLSSIFALVYVQPKEIAMDEVADKLGYSLSSVSNTVKQLEALALIKKVKHPGDKKIYLYIEKNFGKLIHEHVIKKQETVLRISTDKLPTLLKKHNNEKDKLAIIKRYHEQMSMLLNAMTKMTKNLEAELETNH